MYIFQLRIRAWAMPKQDVSRNGTGCIKILQNFWREVLLHNSQKENFLYFALTFLLLPLFLVTSMIKGYFHFQLSVIILCFVGLCWFLLASVGFCWPLLASVGLCWPLALAIVVLSWPFLTSLGLSLPPLASLLPYPSVLDFWKIKLEKSSLTNWIFSLFPTGFLLPV